MIYARYAERLGDDPSHDFADEVHDYFGTGTQLQEMYITPSLLSAQDWDVLAETAKWSRDNAPTLKDSHWIGGDPARLEVYGWASWSPEKAILTLRNPSDQPQDFTAVSRLCWSCRPVRRAPTPRAAHGRASSEKPVMKIPRKRATRISPETV